MTLEQPMALGRTRLVHHVAPELSIHDVLHDRLADAVAMPERFHRDATGPVGRSYRADILLGQLAPWIASAAIRIGRLVVIKTDRCMATFFGCGVSAMPSFAA